MTAVAIVREEKETGSEVVYRAIAGPGKAQAVGSTAGEALDALTAQLGAEDSGTLVVVQQMQPDRFFSQAQMRRLQELMRRSPSAGGSAQTTLTAEEQDELKGLIEAELMASAQRAAALADALGR